MGVKHDVSGTCLRCVLIRSMTEIRKYRRSKVIGLEKLDVG